MIKIMTAGSSPTPGPQRIKGRGWSYQNLEAPRRGRTLLGPSLPGEGTAWMLPASQSEGRPCGAGAQTSELVPLRRGSEAGSGTEEPGTRTEQQPGWAARPLLQLEQEQEAHTFSLRLPSSPIQGPRAPLPTPSEEQPMREISGTGGVPVQHHSFRKRGWFGAQRRELSHRHTILSLFQTAGWRVGKRGAKWERVLS